MRTSPQLTSPMKQLLDKLTSRGSASLDDTELLTLLLGEGGEQAAARRLAERLLEYSIIMYTENHAAHPYA